MDISIPNVFTFACKNTYIPLCFQLQNHFNIRDCRGAMAQHLNVNVTVMGSFTTRENVLFSLIRFDNKDWEALSSATQDTMFLKLGDARRTECLNLSN